MLLPQITNQCKYACNVIYFTFQMARKSQKKLTMQVQNIKKKCGRPPKQKVNPAEQNIKKQRRTTPKQEVYPANQNIKKKRGRPPKQGLVQQKEKKKRVRTEEQKQNMSEYAKNWYKKNKKKPGFLAARSLKSKVLFNY